MLQDEARYKELVKEFYETHGMYPDQFESIWIRQEVIYDYLKNISKCLKDIQEEILIK